MRQGQLRTGQVPVMSDLRCRTGSKPPDLASHCTCRAPSHATCGGCTSINKEVGKLRRFGRTSCLMCMGSRVESQQRDCQASHVTIGLLAIGAAAFSLFTWASPSFDLHSIRAALVDHAQHLRQSELLAKNRKIATSGSAARRAPGCSKLCQSPSCMSHSGYHRSSTRQNAMSTCSVDHSFSSCRRMQ